MQIEQLKSTEKRYAETWHVYFQTRGKWYKKQIPVTLVLNSKQNGVLVFSPYDKDLLEELRNLERARWDADNKCWHVPFTEHNNIAFRYLRGTHTDPTKVCITDYSCLHKLYTHQDEGIKFILTNKCCMLAFEMGLGKTLTTIIAINNTEIDRWWLVAPKGAQYEWKRQLVFWRAKFHFEVVTTYESLEKQLKKYPIPPQGVVFDETIKIKNPASLRSQVAYELTRLMRNHYTDPYIIALSGSPAPKIPTEWWHQIKCIKPGHLKEGSIHRFKQRLAVIEYEEGEFGKYPVIVEWRENELKKLAQRLSSVVLVKTKNDCLDLPDKIYETRKCKVTETIKEYAEIIVNTSSTAIECLERLRELSDGFQYTQEGTCWLGSPKIDEIKSLLNFYHTENGGPGRLVIYAPFKATIIKLTEICKEMKWDTIAVYGGNFPSDTLTRFSNLNNENICIVSNPACMHGVSLKETYALVYYSNSFSSDHRIQSEDRRDRIGMDTTKGTRVIDLVHLPTDEYVLDILRENRRLQTITLDEIRRVLNVQRNTAS